MEEAFAAVRRDDAGTLNRLAESGTDLKSLRDRHGASLLHLCARHGRQNLMHWLIEVGLHPSNRANNGASPAHDSAVCGQLLMLKWLIGEKHCLASDCDGKGVSLMHYGAQVNRVDIVQWLVESCGVVVTEVTSSGLTGAHYAAYNGAVNTLKYLVSKDKR